MIITFACDVLGEENNGTTIATMNVARAMANGIVENLFAPMPESVIKSRKRIVGSGNGLAKCAAVRRALQERCNLPFVMPQVREEAATGAARHASIPS